jgi:AbrB family looped-hinge helix DNA binding protein
MFGAGLPSGAIFWVLAARNRWSPPPKGVEGTLRNIATVNSKGQMTVPLTVRDRSGVKAGDRLEFVFEAAAVVVWPFRGEDNPFATYAGALGTFPDGAAEINAWVRELRDDDDLERIPT